ncbi:AP1 endonuclease [Elysia marginata]|uniref:AP1 endonuclease n=1 Tax=Elysia marginata TaxID=1093978 RepID=A0AAV4HU30_9GAST|nr:AP1 endonuclease [Elysia marginata]
MNHGNRKCKFYTSSIGSVQEPSHRCRSWSYCVVGALISKRAKKALLDAKRITNQILRVDFDGNPKSNVLIIYSPTNAAEKSVVEELYRYLRNTLQNIPAPIFVTILGDFNARTGSEVAPHTFQGAKNRNGFFLADLLPEFDLLVGNGQFRKGPEKLWAFKDRVTVSTTAGLHTDLQEMEKQFDERRGIKLIQHCRLGPQNCLYQALTELEGLQTY